MCVCMCNVHVTCKIPWQNMNDHCRWVSSQQHGGSASSSRVMSSSPGFQDYMRYQMYGEDISFWIGGDRGAMSTNLVKFLSWNWLENEGFPKKLGLDKHKMKDLLPYLKFVITHITQEQWFKCIFCRVMSAPLLVSYLGTSPWAPQTNWSSSIMDFLTQAEASSRLAWGFAIKIPSQHWFKGLRVSSQDFP